jgi:hypothetical protein
MRHPVKQQTWANAKRRRTTARALPIHRWEEPQNTRPQPSLAPMPWLTRPMVPLGDDEREEAL